MQAKSFGERWVHGCNHALISLAGPHGGGDSKSRKPFTRGILTNDHFTQAKNNLKLIVGMSEDEAEAEG